MMSDEHAKSKKVHGKLDSNVIQFPKPPEAGGSGSKEDVGNEPPTSSISSLSGIPMETIQQVSKVEGWTRLHSRMWDYKLPRAVPAV